MILYKLSENIHCLFIYFSLYQFYRKNHSIFFCRRPQKRHVRITVIEIDNKKLKNNSRRRETERENKVRRTHTLFRILVKFCVPADTQRAIKILFCYSSWVHSVNIETARKVKRREKLKNQNASSSEWNMSGKSVFNINITDVQCQGNFYSLWLIAPLLLPFMPSFFFLCFTFWYAQKYKKMFFFFSFFALLWC